MTPLFPEQLLIVSSGSSLTGLQHVSLSLECVERHLCLGESLPSGEQLLSGGADGGLVGGEGIAKLEVLGSQCLQFLFQGRGLVVQQLVPISGMLQLQCMCSRVQFQLQSSESLH